MKTIEEIRDELLEMSYERTWEESNIGNDIIMVFGDYEFEGIDEIIVNIQQDKIQAYANHEDAPILVIKIERKEALGLDIIGIEDVYIY